MAITGGPLPRLRRVGFRMRMTACACLELLVLFTSTPAVSQGLGEIVYHGAVSTQSSRKATVQLVSGAATRRTLDQDVLPEWLTRGSWEARHPTTEGTFDAENQQEFCSALALALVHLGLFKQAVDTSANQSADVHLRVTFNNTVYHTAQHRYVLDVELQIEGDGTVSSMHYVANSSDGRQWVPKGTSGLEAAKTGAAADLLQKIIPDVEGWLQQSHASSPAPAPRSPEPSP
jgi:hypothetical protein